VTNILAAFLAHIYLLGRRGSGDTSSPIWLTACRKNTGKHIKGCTATKMVHIYKTLGLCLNKDFISQVRGQHSSSTHSRGTRKSLAPVTSWHFHIAVP